jgi:hypothetical protein
LKQGNLNFVLPKFQNMKYVEIGVGDNFGLEDIVGSLLKHDDLNLSEWMQHRDKVVRQFTVMSSPQDSDDKSIIL